jgi:hypothetical protein
MSTVAALKFKGRMSELEFEVEVRRAPQADPE